MPAVSNLGAQIERALTGRLSAPMAPPDLRGRLLAVQAEYGSGTKAARAVGVSESTWRRWRVAAGLSTSSYQRSGRRAPGSAQPAGPTLGRLVERAEAAVRGRAIVNRPSDRSIVVKASHPAGADEGRKRTIPARALELRPGTADKVVQAYISGGADEAARAFLRGVRNDYFGPALAYDGPDPPDPGYGLTVTSIIF